MKNIEVYYFVLREQGQTLVEYAMIMLFVVLVSIVVLQSIGIDLSALIDTFVNAAF